MISIINALDYVYISECKNYKSMTDWSRKLHNSAIKWTAKTDHLVHSNNSVRADRSVDWQGEGWYRVHSYAGTRILENPFTIAQVQSGMYVCIYLFSSIQIDMYNK